MLGRLFGRGRPEPDPEYVALCRAALKALADHAAYARYDSAIQDVAEEFSDDLSHADMPGAILAFLGELGESTPLAGVMDSSDLSTKLPRNPCNSAASQPWRFAMSAEANKALVRRWFEELDKRNFAIIDELIPEDYVDHNPPLPDLPPGREGVRQSSMRLYAAFPDAVHILDDQMAEGDKVMTRLTTRATFQGEILGIQPTGRLIEVSGIAVHRVADGRLVEHWAHLDMAGFMQQLEEPIAEPVP